MILGVSVSSVMNVYVLDVGIPPCGSVTFLQLLRGSLPDISKAFTSKKPLHDPGVPVMVSGMHLILSAKSDSKHYLGSMSRLRPASIHRGHTALRDL